MNASMHDVIQAKVVSYYIATVTSYIKLNASGIGDGSKVEIAINLNNYKTLYFSHCTRATADHKNKSITVANTFIKPVVLVTTIFSFFLMWVD